MRVCWSRASNLVRFMPVKSGALAEDRRAMTIVVVIWRGFGHEVWMSALPDHAGGLVRLPSRLIVSSLASLTPLVNLAWL